MEHGALASTKISTLRLILDESCLILFVMINVAYADGTYVCFI